MGPGYRDTPTGAEPCIAAGRANGCAVDRAPARLGGNQTDAVTQSPAVLDARPRAGPISSAGVTSPIWSGAVCV